MLSLSRLQTTLGNLQEVLDYNSLRTKDGEREEQVCEPAKDSVALFLLMAMVH